MDLHFTSATATAEERDAVDAALAPEPEGKIRRHLVLPLLHAVQDRCGWISAGALNFVSERLSVAPADVYGVATFYKLFSTTQKPGRLVHVCDDIACVAAGAEALCREMERSGVAWERSPCLG
ncbi:MAG: NAD(P)H-dependent oxidoreductase subunit E, partial [Candidatus Cybelea sp.]